MVQVFQSASEAKFRAMIAWGAMFVVSAAVAFLLDSFIAPISAVFVVPMFVVAEYSYGQSNLELGRPRLRSLWSRLGDFLEVVFYAIMMSVALSVFVLVAEATFRTGLRSHVAMVGFPFVAWAALLLLMVLGGIIRLKAKAHAIVTSHGQ